jgi:ketosteroid isomerase-like protein
VTSANVQLVWAIYEDWGRGDFSSLDWAHPDFELALVDGPNPGRWRGADAGAAWRDMLATWDDFRAVAEDVTAIDAGRVLVLTRNTGRGKTSGLELGDMETRGANVLHLRDGKVARIDAYFSRDLALAELDNDPRGLTP